MANVSVISSTHGFDYEHRDPVGINEHVQVWFEDSFAEPDSTHSVDDVWSCSYRTFNCSKKYCYFFVSAICAGPSAFLCGLFFAIQSCFHIWCVGPCLKCFLMELNCYQKYWRAIVQCYCDPLYESLSKIFGNIKFHQKYETV